MTHQDGYSAAGLRSVRGSRWLALPLLLACLEACAPGDANPTTADASAASPDLKGRVELEYVERPAGASKLEYSIVHNGTQRVLLMFRAAPDLAPGTELAFWGDWEGDSRFIVRDFQIESIPKRLDASWTRKPMLHRVAVLTADTVSATESAVASEFAEVNRFFTETTRGVDTFSMALYRNYNLGLSTTDCDNKGAVMSRIEAAFTQQGFNAANYEHLVFIVPKSCGSWWGASASVGGVGDNGSYAPAKRSIFKDDVAHAFPFIHELGHNLGMRHAQSAQCSGGFYAPSLAGCTITEYGDSNDPMGGGWTEVYWNTPHQRFLGWMAPERVITAGGSGTFNLTPSDAKQGCGIQALRIPIPNEPATYFYLEYRKARSDSPYAGTGKDTHQDAVLLTRSQDGLRDNSSTQRIQVGTSDFMGLASKTYDLGSGVTVALRRMGPDAAQVAVQAPGTSPHRDDAGHVVAALSDGSVGPTSCSAPPTSVDNCPNDPNKTEPGQCGCGVPDGVDSANYRDAQNFACADWQGYDCTRAADAYGYTQEQQASILSNCAFSCKVCGTGSVDNCPNDPNKTEPGQCGCGVADTDGDGDGTLDCRDGCPADAKKTASGICGCGTADIDSDGDGTADCRDSCPADPKKDAPGACGCGVAEGSCGASTALQCVKTGEGSTAQLACPAGATISTISFASYGTPTGTCGSFAVSSCNAQSSRSVVEAACLGKASCAVPAQNVQFGDPCGGTPKQLAVQFTCSLQPGLKRAHYAGTWSALPNFTQLTPDVQDVATTVALGPYAGTDGFGLVFTGQLQIGTAGGYDFELGSDDGSKLFIDGKQIVSNDGLHGFVTVTGTTALSQGYHDVRVEFFERTVGESLRLRYGPTGATLIEVPAAALFH